MSAPTRIVAPTKLAYGEITRRGNAHFTMPEKSRGVVPVGLCPTEKQPGMAVTGLAVRKTARCGSCMPPHARENSRCGSNPLDSTATPRDLSDAYSRLLPYRPIIPALYSLLLPHLAILPSARKCFWYTPPDISGTSVSSSTKPRDSSGSAIPTPAAPLSSSGMEAMTPPYPESLCCRRALYVRRGHAKLCAPFSTRSIYLPGTKSAAR